MAISVNFWRVHFQLLPPTKVSFISLRIHKLLYMFTLSSPGCILNGSLNTTKRVGSGAVGTDRYISLRNVSSVAFEMFTTRKLKDITDKECHKTF